MFAQQRRFQLQLRLLSSIELHGWLRQLRRQSKQRLRDEPSNQRPALQRLRRRLCGWLRMSGGSLRVRQQQRLRNRSELLQRSLHRHPHEHDELRRLRHHVRLRSNVLQRQLSEPRDRLQQLRELRPELPVEQQPLHQWLVPLHHRLTMLRLLHVLLEWLSHSAALRRLAKKSAVTRITSAGWPARSPADAR